MSAINLTFGSLKDLRRSLVGGLCRALESPHDWVGFDRLQRRRLAVV